MAAKGNMRIALVIGHAQIVAPWFSPRRMHASSAERRSPWVAAMTEIGAAVAPAHVGVAGRARALDPVVVASVLLPEDQVAVAAVGCLCSWHSEVCGRFSQAVGSC